MPVRRASSFFVPLEKLSSSRRPRRAAQCTARNISCENIGMVETSIPRCFAKYKQKSRGCHTSSVAATGLSLVLTSRFWTSVISALDLFLRLAQAIFQRPQGKVSLFLIDQERGRQANGVLTRTEH